MKKLFLTFAISLFLGTAVMAHGFGNRGFNRDDSATWRQMDTWHDAMHGISVDTDKIDDGVSIKIEAESDEIVQTLRNDFKLNQETLSQYFDGTSVKVDDDGKNIAITITSDDENIVDKLQNWRRGLVFEYLRDQMMGQYSDRRGCWGANGGRGMRGGYYHHWDSDYGHMNWEGAGNGRYFGGHMM